MRRNASLQLALACLVAMAAPALAEGGKGKKYALLVGVKSYEHSKLSDLEFSENDVTEMAALLRPAGFQVALLTDTEGKKDPVRKPTAKNIRAAVKAVLAGKGKDD